MALVVLCLSCSRCLLALRWLFSGLFGWFGYLWPVLLCRFL